MPTELNHFVVMLWPVIVIQFLLQAYCLVDLLRWTYVRTNNKLLWGIIIVLGGFLGSLVYLLFRGHEE